MKLKSKDEGRGSGVKAGGMFFVDYGRTTTEGLVGNALGFQAEPMDVDKVEDDGGISSSRSVNNGKTPNFTLPVTHGL